MDVSPIVESVFSLFLMILVGVYGSKKKIITNEINKGLTDILLQIALPFMIVNSFIFTYDDAIKSNVINMFYYSIAAYIVMTGLSYLLVIPIKDDKKTIVHFANIFTNTGYIGFPILYSIYGQEGVIYGSVFNMFFVIFVWTYGIMLFKGDFDRQQVKTEIKNILFNPSIIAVFIGIIIMTFDIKVPHMLLASIEGIGNISGPLSMLIIGNILSKVKFKDHLKDWSLYYGIFTKLILIPIIIYGLSLLIKDKSMAINTTIIMTGMPASAMTSILAESFGKEKEYAAILVSLTTLLSLISAPLLIGLLN